MNQSLGRATMRQFFRVLPAFNNHCRLQMTQAEKRGFDYHDRHNRANENNHEDHHKAAIF
jgi:hypothetical protein